VEDVYEKNKRGGWIFFLWRVEFFKIGKRDVTFIREMRVHENSKLKPGENMLCTEIVSNIQINFCTQHVPPYSHPI
jgi:hypothetical protein